MVEITEIMSEKQVEGETVVANGQQPGSQKSDNAGFVEQKTKQKRKRRRRMGNK